MRPVLNALRYTPKRSMALVGMFAAALAVPAVLFAWGPDRPTYTVEHPADHVTFNSITNNPHIGDERNFVGIRETGSTGTWKDTVTAEPGKSYVVRMYVHNNAAENLKLVAKDVTAKFNLPTNTAKSLQVNGFLSASNAAPKEVYDHATFTSAQDFNLSYQTGTLKYYNNHFGSAGATISESVFTSAGAKLGYDKLDGSIPGCFKYAGYLTFTVKPQFATPKSDFTVEKQVRKDSTTAWNKSVDAKPGDKLDYRIVYKNTGETQQKNVTLKDTLPAGISPVAGSVRIMNATHASGATVADGDKLFTSGINIGAYTAGSNAIVIFDATVASNGSLPTCGANALKNVASAQPEGQQPKTDDATVKVPKECTETPKYACSGLTVTPIGKTKFTFKATHTSQGATYKTTTYVVRDETGKELSRSADTTYTQTKPGTYTVEALVTFTVNGSDKTVTASACKKSFEIPEDETPVTPSVSCDSLTYAKISRTEYTFTGVASAEEDTSIVSYTFDFGDGNTKTVKNPIKVAHTYQQAKAYTIKLRVTFKVGDNTVTKTSDACKVQITVTPETPEECKPGIPVGDARCETPKECKPGVPVGDERCKEEHCDVIGKEHLPKNSPDCVEPPVTPPTPETPEETPKTPSELPKTGTGETITAVLGIGSLITALGYYVASRRALIG